MANLLFLSAHKGHLQRGSAFKRNAARLFFLVALGETQRFLCRLFFYFIISIKNAFQLVSYHLHFAHLVQGGTMMRL